MRIFYSLKGFLKSPFSKRKYAVTIGVFDGVHRAHQEIIRKVIDKAKKNRLESFLITFDPHPANVSSGAKKAPSLISLRHRLNILESEGIENVVVAHFDKSFSNMSAKEFMKNILGTLNIREIVIGRNFFFGRNKEGSLKDLKEFSLQMGCGLTVIEPRKTSGRVISSTRIRNLILNGRLSQASKLLKRPVTILGTVIKGNKRGRIIGFPTANINPHHEVIPPSGVYAVRVKIGNNLYKGILNIGFRPTFKSESAYLPEPTVEVHIFGFNKSIYGRDLEIIFVGKIRKEKKFRDAARLRRQIERDGKRAAAMLD